MKKNLLIFFFTMFFTCNLASASTWQSLKAGKKPIEIDTSNMYVATSDFGKDLYFYWIRTKKQDGIYQIHLATICGSDENFILKTIKLNYKGKLLSQKENKIPTTQPIVKGSGAEAAYKYVCMVDANKFKNYDTYAEIAQKALDEHNFELARINALNVYNETIRLSEEGYSKMHIADALDLLARAYSGLGNNAGALNAWNEALSIAQNYTDEEFIQTLITRRDIMQEFVDSGNKFDQNEQENQLNRPQFKNTVINTGMQIIRSFTGY